MAVSVFLTVADHDANGFVHLGQWPFHSEALARDFMASVDRSIDPEAEPDQETANYWFILDLWNGNDRIAENERRIPLQTAMRLATDNVRNWVLERPDPDTLCMTASYSNPPILAAVDLQFESHDL